MHATSSATSPVAGAEPGVTTYLCSGTGLDDLLQWRNSNGDLSGTYEEAQLSETAPSEQVSSNSGSLRGTLNGNQLTLSIGSSQDLYRPVSGGQLSLNVPQSDGSIIFMVFVAPQSDFDRFRPTYEAMLKSLRF